MTLDRRTREEIVKGNQMTALRFQTAGRHRLPFGGKKQSNQPSSQWFRPKNPFKTKKKKGGGGGQAG